MLTPARRLARPRSRIEYFVFSLLAEMRGQQVQLYAIKRDGDLRRYPKVEVYGESCMPSGGALSNPNDQALVKGLEDKMIDAYGTALVELKCKAPDCLGRVDLSCKMLRPQHVGALFAAVERYQVTKLVLSHNQLGAEGGALVAAALKTNTTLTKLWCAQLGRSSNQGHSGRRARLKGPWISPAHRTAHTQPAHTESPPLRPTSPHAAWTAATPSFAPRVGGATSVHPHACTCPSQAGGQRPRRRHQAGPQGGRPQRPRAVPLASGKRAALYLGPRLCQGQALGAEGGALVAAALKTNTTLTELQCAQLGRPSNLGH